MTPEAEKRNFELLIKRNPRRGSLGRSRDDHHWSPTGWPGAVARSPAPTERSVQISRRVVKNLKRLLPECAEHGAIAAPPGGHVAGIYARSDREQGVWRAPARKQILGIDGLDQNVTDEQGEALNAVGVNTLRTFPGGGNLIWGARTTSQDPEWKYVNIRRYFSYLEHSIDNGTQWVVFEPNGEPLWDAVRRSVSDFLFNEWRSGALQGSRPDEAFFVRCDQTTMTQDDIDNGRLVVEVGIAALRPAEFVVVRIGQWTANANPNGCQVPPQFGSGLL